MGDALCKGLLFVHKGTFTDLPFTWGFYKGPHLYFRSIHQQLMKLIIISQPGGAVWGKAHTTIFIASVSHFASTGSSSQPAGLTFVHTAVILWVLVLLSTQIVMFVLQAYTLWLAMQRSLNKRKCEDGDGDGDDDYMTMMLLLLFTSLIAQSRSPRARRAVSIMLHPIKCHSVSERWTQELQGKSALALKS